MIINLEKFRFGSFINNAILVVALVSIAIIALVSLVVSSYHTFFTEVSPILYRGIAIWLAFAFTTCFAFTRRDETIKHYKVYNYGFYFFITYSVVLAVKIAFDFLSNLRSYL